MVSSVVPTGGVHLPVKCECGGIAKNSVVYIAGVAGKNFEHCNQDFWALRKSKDVFKSWESNFFKNTFLMNSKINDFYRTY